MKRLLEDIVKTLVDHPEAVEVKEIVGEHALIYELRVAPDDRGKVIGKGGATGAAIRTLMAAASGKARRRHIVEII